MPASRWLGSDIHARRKDKALDSPSPAAPNTLTTLMPACASIFGGTTQLSGLCHEGLWLA